MAVFVRKLNARRNIDDIRCVENVKDTPADAITSEFKTKSNTLSVWHVAGKNAAEQGILAIALSSSHIETMDFVLFDEKTVLKNGLSVVRTSPGKNPYSPAEGMHFDISEMCLKSLSDICQLYRDIDSSCIIRKTKSELKKLIIQAHRDGLIDTSAATDDLLKDLRNFGIA